MHVAALFVFYLFMCVQVVLILFINNSTFLRFLSIQERVEVDMISDALVQREMFHELALTVVPDFKLNEESDWHPGQKDVHFAGVLR